MNLIICDENCRHKQDGYCALNHISQLTDDISAKCGYFEADGVTASDVTTSKLKEPAKYFRQEQA